MRDYSSRGSGAFYNNESAQNNQHKNREELCRHGKHFVLGAGEYLLDYRKDIRAYIEEEESQLQVFLDEEVMEKAYRVYEDTGIGVEEHLRQFLFYSIEHEEMIEKWKNVGMLEIPDEYKLMSVKGNQNNEVACYT